MANLETRFASLYDSLVESNDARGGGTLGSTDVLSNTATSNRGGINMVAGSLVVRDANRPLGNLTLRYSLIAFNAAATGGGVLNEGTLNRLGNTFVGNAGGDCVGC